MLIAEYTSFMKETGDVSLPAVEEYFQKIQKSKLSPLTVKKRMNILTDLLRCSFGLPIGCLHSRSDTTLPPCPGRVLSQTTRENVESALYLLQSSGNLQDYVLLSLIYYLQVYPRTLRLLRFEDVSISAAGRASVVLHTAVKGRRTKKWCEAGLAEAVIQLKAVKSQTSHTFRQATRKVNPDRQIKGHFIFEDSLSKMNHRLASGFGGAVPGFSAKA